jgi:hypothetical protein
MNEIKTTEKPVAVTAEQARAQARKQADASKFIVARIKAAKAKRQANRPKPRVDGAAE